MPTTLRHLAMLRRIPRAPGFIATPDLRSALENLDYTVDIRTVQRDLEALSSVFPLYCDTSSKPYRWQWLAGAEILDIPGLDANSALVFKLAEMFLGPLLPLAAMETLMPYFRCADRVLGETGARCGSWKDKVRVLPRGQRLLAPDVDRDILNTVHQGLFFGRQIKISCRARNMPEVREYVVNPLGLVLRNGLLYLVVTFNKYQDIRQLLLYSAWAGFWLFFWPETGKADEKADEEVGASETKARFLAVQGIVSYSLRFSHSDIQTLEFVSNFDFRASNLPLLRMGWFLAFFLATDGKGRRKGRRRGWSK